jgi:aryl-alcohol dehydrogenase-like predicted oxidoreductase
VLATKVWSPFDEAPNRDFGLSAYKIKRQLEESLRRLQTDRVELYQMHYVDRATGWDEKLAAFEDLIRQGKVDYLGSSNHAGWDLAQAQGVARDIRFVGIVSEQHHYNLLFRDAEREVLPCCRAHGIALLTYSPIAGGLLGGHADNPEEPARSNSDHVRGLLRNRQSQITAFLNLCHEVGHSPAAVAVAWQLHQPGITCPIIGPRTLAQVEGFEHTAEICLGPEFLVRLDDIFPPTGQYLANIPSRVCRCD